MRGEVVAGGDGDGPAGYFRYDFQDDEILVEGAVGARDVDVRWRGRRTLGQGREEFRQGRRPGGSGHGRSQAEGGEDENV